MSRMSDESSYNYYADPDNRAPEGVGRRRASRPMSSHVPVRFRPDVIAEVKEVSRQDRKTISSWIRDLVERELERRRPRYPRSEAISHTVEGLKFTGVRDGATVVTTTTSQRVLEDV